MSTGDRTILEAQEPYLVSEPLRSDERSRYETPELSDERGTVLEHCRRSLTLVSDRGVGAHGLPLMLGGDWNDGLDAMGKGAESGWLGWFFADVCRRFAGLCESETESARWREEAERVGAAARKTLLGDHFARAYFGDGEVLGGELFVDALVQAWAALSPDVDDRTANAALDTAMRVLYDGEHRLLRLCAPPFLPSERSAGYIASYGAGFRENGGQYTHAALFLARAMFFRRRAEDGWRLMCCAMPGGHGERYGAEPYSIPADICSAAGSAGRAGWTWYTGAAGVFLRAAEDMLGLRLRNGAPDPDFSAQLPAALDGLAAKWRAPDGSEWVFNAQNDAKFTKQPFSSDKECDIIQD